jgi:hypothetical protein
LTYNKPYGIIAKTTIELEKKGHAATIIFLESEEKELQKKELSYWFLRTKRLKIISILNTNIVGKNSV